MSEVYARVHLVISHTAWFSWAWFPAFTQCFSQTKSHISKCKIHIMLKLFPFNVLKQICTLKASMITGPLNLLGHTIHAVLCLASPSG